MNMRAVIASILLASSSVAMADGLAVQNLESAAFRRPGTASWAPLTQMVTANRVTTIKLDDCRDELRALRIQAGTGATYIYSMTLQYEDGSRHTIEVNQWAYWGVPRLAIAMPQRRVGVAKITVNTWTWFPSTFQVFGERVSAPEMPPLPPPPTPPMPSAGIVIGQNLTFANSAGYVQMRVGAEKGDFTKLKLDGTGTLTYVGKIYVSFPAGNYQTINVNKALRRGEQITLDLEGSRRAVSAVTVMAGDDYGSVGNAGSRFSVSLF